MIGNDIVDLNIARKSHRWYDRRFLDKVFTSEEQDLIAEADHNFKAIWLLWTMKESAYKVFIQQGAKPFFGPREIKCQMCCNTNGTVNVREKQYKTFSCITNKYIYTIAHSGNSGNIISKCARLSEGTYKAQHEICNLSFLMTYSKLTDTEVDVLEIRKNKAGAPRIYKQNKKQSIPFSTTHHGNYYGHALIL